MERHSISLDPLSSPSYGAGLKAQIGRDEPQQLLDSLLVSGLIEARSRERLGLLAAYCPYCELAQFFHGLMASEVRHYSTYWLLADKYLEHAVITQRLEELAIVESQLLATLHPKSRLYS